MAFDGSDRLWALNHHLSTVEVFDPNNGHALLDSHSVPWDPVSLAYWDGEGTQGPEMLVVCRGTWGVVGLDVTDGHITRLIQGRDGDPAILTQNAGGDSSTASSLGLMAEPADILVDNARNVAFISCTGSDSVVQVDLVTNEITAVINEETQGSHTATPDGKNFRLKSPLFLAWDGPEGSDVMVAPMHSGNGTKAAGSNANKTPTGVERAWREPGGAPLPDEDLFRIQYSSGGTVVDGAASVALLPATALLYGRWGTGTILFDHGKNPNTSSVAGKYWQLNTQANNHKVLSEQDHNGKFSQNRLTIIDFDVTSHPQSAMTIKDLDALGPGGDVKVGQPFSLTFDAQGNGFIVGVLTNNLVALDNNGDFLDEFFLGKGAIPRAVLASEEHSDLYYVYCWGSNEVLTVSFDTSTGSFSTASGLAGQSLNLGVDPTPANIARGRELFFDGEFSATGSMSCATCHVEGGTDFLAWNLDNKPHDSKGAMFTQTLVGIDRLAPYHWRGERQFADFRGAFDALLGSPVEFTEAQFEDLEAYVFSLKNPANPNQARNRRVSPAIHHPAAVDGSGNPLGNALVGTAQFVDRDFSSVGQFSCVACHGMPAGTNNDLVVDQELSSAPRRGFLVPAAFHELWRKDQSTVSLGVYGERSFLGSGFAHAGGFVDLLDFVEAVTVGKPPKTTENLTDLIHQWDQGLAPAVHFGVHLDGDSDLVAARNEIEFLMDQGDRLHCDVVIVGRALDTQGVLRDTRWYWDSAVPAFVSEHPSLHVNRHWDQFLEPSRAAVESNLFLGLPVGMGERFAIDADLDGTLNGTDASADFPIQVQNGPKPQFLSLPQVLWKTARNARVAFETDALTNARIEYWEVGDYANRKTVHSPYPSKHHSLLLTDMRPTTVTVDAEGELDPEIHDEYLPEDVIYDFRVVAEVLNDSSRVPHLQNPQILTDSFSTPEGLDWEQQVDNRLMRDHVVDAIALDADYEGLIDGKDVYNLTVDATVLFRRGLAMDSDSSGAQDGAENRRLIGRLLVKQANPVVLEHPVRVAEVASIGALPIPWGTPLIEPSKDTTFFHKGPIRAWTPEFQALIDGALGPMSLDQDGSTEGTVMISKTTTDFDGKLTMHFRVEVPPNQVLSGDEFFFNVEGVVEVPPTDNGIFTTFDGGELVVAIPVKWRRGPFIQWSFPATTEAEGRSYAATPIPVP